MWQINHARAFSCRESPSVCSAVIRCKIPALININNCSAIYCLFCLRFCFILCLFGILISLLGTLPYALVFNIIAVVFGLHPATLLYTTAITVLFTLFVNYEQLLFDLAFPKLNWENETAAIKSNNRSLISVLIDLTVGAILIGAGYLLYGKLHLNIHITTSMMILLTAVLTFAMRTALFKWGVQVMEHLESA